MLVLVAVARKLVVNEGVAWKLAAAVALTFLTGLKEKITGGFVDGRIA